MIKDETGRKFGRLEVIRLSKNRKHSEAVWVCRCKCGRVARVTGNKLRSGWTKSCGCRQKESRTKHGGWGTRTYWIWHGAVQRCTNSKATEYQRYGGSGIKVCRRWLKFKKFLKDMGECPSNKHSIDRFPNQEGDYEPANCRWATSYEQTRNTRRNRLVAIGDVSKCATDWANLLTVRKNAFAYWLDKGLSGSKLLRKAKSYLEERGLPIPDVLEELLYGSRSSSSR